MKTHLQVSLVSILLIAPSGLQAQWSGPDAPDSLSFQGFLTDDSGVPVDNAVDMTFKLYKGANEIWSQTKANVAVSNGVFNVILGGTGLTSLDTVAFNVPIELGIKVGTDSEISPRTPLVSAAFALGMRGMYAVWASDGDGNESLNVIGGAANNNVGADVVGATIGGGGGTNVGSSLVPNSVTNDFGTVGGGMGNTAGGRAATLGGGDRNTAGGVVATVGGGVLNSAGGAGATVGGGQLNTASGGSATVGGGVLNSATGIGSTVAGGDENIASGPYAAAPGGRLNQATGGYTFAAGFKARAIHSGAFVWADSASSSGVDFLSTGVNQFLIRAAGGVGIGTNAPNTQFSVVGDADFANNVAIGKIAASAPLDIQGGNFDLNATEGDIRVGTATNRLKIGVATGGGGAGRAIIRAQGTAVPELRLGAEDADVVIINKGDGLIPAVTNTYTLGKSGNEWSEVWATSGTVSSSDRRLKQDISPLDYGLDAVLTLEPVSYYWKSSPEGTRRIGLIAQDVESVVPEIVHHGESPEDMLGLNYAELVPVLIKAIQEQQERIEGQNRRLAVLEARMTN